MSALTDGMRQSLNVEVRDGVMGYLVTAAPFLMLATAALVATAINGWCNKLAVCLVIGALAVVMVA